MLFPVTTSDTYNLSASLATSIPAPQGEGLDRDIPFKQCLEMFLSKDLKILKSVLCNKVAHPAVFLRKKKKNYGLLSSLLEWQHVLLMIYLNITINFICLMSGLSVIYGVHICLNVSAKSAFSSQHLVTICDQHKPEM